MSDSKKQKILNIQFFIYLANTLLNLSNLQIISKLDREFEVTLQAYFSYKNQ